MDHVRWALAIIHGGGCLGPIPQELTLVERETLMRQTALHAVIVAGGLEWRPEALAYDHVCAAGLSCAVARIEAISSPDFSEEAFSSLNPALIRFSSGTTGASKGVVLSHESLRERIESANNRLQITSWDRVLWTLPMAHHFAVSILLYLSEGAGVILAEARFADELLETALRFEATVMYGSPFHYRLLASEASGRAWPTLRLAVSTAAALTEEIATRFWARFGVRLVQGLGIIEVGLPLLNTSHAEDCPTALGVPDDFEVALSDREGMAEDEGELCLRGPGMFDAYLVPWQLRDEVLRDGWFHTGDIVKWLDNGSIQLVGRSKSVLNIAGMKCFPEEIEAVLCAFPGVLEALVRGEENVRWGTVPVAEMVPLNPGAPPVVAELAAYCRRMLAPFKVPVRFEFVGRLEKTANGKLRRK